MIRQHGLAMSLSGVMLVACSTTAQQPASVDTRNDSCAHCRMTVSDVRFAAQLVASGEEPRFFDDIGCLRDFLEKGPVPKDATTYVADHRTKAWTIAAAAVYVRNDRINTPMGSHLLAFADTASRLADPDGAGTEMTAKDVFGTPGPPAKGRTP